MHESDDGWEVDTAALAAEAEAGYDPATIERVIEPVEDDEVEEPDQWGRTPDWNWPRNYGGNPRD